MRLFANSLTAALMCLAGAATAQERRPSHCIAVADANPGLYYVHNASFDAPVSEHSVLLHYIAHSSFLIRTHGGRNMITDYTGFVGSARFTPDVVTMNHAHDSHWTAHPDPAIAHVLPGWGPFGQGIEHHLDLGDVLIRNVPTDIRSPSGGFEPRGNSIFVFEVGGLCVGHLGHLHHEPDDAQYAALGRLDVVLAPVDGGMTLPLPVMMNVLRRLRSSIVIPMHWFGDYTLDAFLVAMSDDFAIERTGRSSMQVSLRNLPKRPTIFVLRPAWLQDDE